MVRQYCDQYVVCETVNSPNGIAAPRPRVISSAVLAGTTGAGGVQGVIV